ncbi:MULTISPECIES: extracellular solute-binding protein [Rhizobium/Agrobacterium group]|uniref:Extracellular solute-binding protein n=1 Tax=Agrobacterium cucumeris TaxID=2862866 RepID=A0ABY8RWY4_9HYPH|nr:MULTISPECIES: extracellular solute-binding protein [Rhizobium/Agrobacterium group]MCZ7472698.1 extracellular solute-binding protein [Rhizobium rhizogenes]MCZ7484149.1 extracellular solute-binding protein [Rhizobium rhizogenes]WHO11643.1 extracellular solute-binding protein [Agrobacterium cucumeris]
MTRFVTAILLGGALAGFPANGFSRDFTVNTAGGVYSDMLHKHFFEPFGQQNGLSKVLDNKGEARWGGLKAMIDTNQRPYDVVETEIYEQMRACDEGLFVKLDLVKLGIADKLNPDSIFPCGVGVGITAVTVVSREGTFPEKPKTIEDFFNLAKFPGKRGLRATAQFSLELALLADGVEPSELYAVMATTEGLDRAFAKLGTIKQQLVFWESGAQSVQLLTGGDVAMSTGYSHRVAAANLNGEKLDMTWDRAFLNHDAFAILDGAEHADLAVKFLQFYADPKREAEFIKEMPMGPAMKETINYLSPDLIKLLPVGDNIKTALDASSPEALAFWLDNGDRITRRWTAWKTSK